MKKFLLSFFTLLTFSLTSFAQTSKYAVGLFTDIMLEAPSYDTFYGITGKYDYNKHTDFQAFVGYSNFHMTTIGADVIYNLKDKTKSNFNIYGGIGISGDFYKRKIEVEYEGVTSNGYAKANYLAINPTIGLSYYFSAIKSSFYAGYKVKFYPFEGGALDINYLSIGLRYHL